MRIGNPKRLFGWTLRGKICGMLFAAGAVLLILLMGVM